MLLLSRKRNEKIRIGHDIVVTVASINGNKARIAIEAPDHVSIHREEVYKEIQSRGATHEPQSPTKPTSLEDKTQLGLIDLLSQNGYRITDEIRVVVAKCSQDFSSMMFLVKG